MDIILILITNASYYLQIVFQLIVMVCVQSVVLIIILILTMSVKAFLLIVILQTSMELVMNVMTVIKSTQMECVNLKTLIFALCSRIWINTERKHGRIVGLVPKCVLNVQVVIIWTKIANVKRCLKIVHKQTQMVNARNVNQDVRVKTMSV